MKITDLQLTDSVRQEDFLLVHNSNESVAKRIKALDLITNNVSTSTDNVVLVESDQFSVNVPSGQVTLIFSHLNTSFGDTIEVNMPSSPSIGDMTVIVKTITAIQNGMNYKLIFPDKYDSVYSSELGEGLEYGLSNETIVDYIIYTNFGWFLSSYKIIDTRFPFTDRHITRWDIDTNAPLNVVNNKLDLQDDKKLDYWDTDNNQIMDASSADCEYKNFNWEDSNSELVAGSSISFPPSGGTVIRERAWRSRKDPNSSNSYTAYIFGDHNPGDPNYPDAEVVMGFTTVGWFYFGNIPSQMINNTDKWMYFQEYRWIEDPESNALDRDGYAIQGWRIRLSLRLLDDENGVTRPVLRKEIQGSNSGSFPNSWNSGYDEPPESVYQGLEIEDDTWHLIISSDVVYKYKEGSGNTDNKEWTFQTSMGVATPNKLYFITGEEYSKYKDSGGVAQTDTIWLINRLAFRFQIYTSGYIDTVPWQWDDIRIIKYPISQKKDFAEMAKRYGL